MAEEALACFQRAVEIKPEYAEAHNNLGMELGNREKMDDAAACYRRAAASSIFSRQGPSGPEQDP